MPGNDDLDQGGVERDRLLREEGNFESDEYVHFLDFSDGLINNMYFKTLHYIIYIYIVLLHINYTSIVYF